MNRKSRIPTYRSDNVPFDHQLKDLAPMIDKIMPSPDLRLLILSYCKPQRLCIDHDNKSLVVDLEYKLYMTITPDLIAIYIMGMGYLYITDMWLYLSVKEREGLEFEIFNFGDLHIGFLGKILYLDSESGTYRCNFARHPEIRFRKRGIVYSTSHIKPLDLPSMVDDIRILDDALIS